MLWDNNADLEGPEPAHWAHEDPDLIGRCGNLLQAGCESRPQVDGVDVGARIECRYENGELTDKPLWPWPMNERIRVATCMYDEGLTREACKADPSLGTDVTTTVFSLGGGTVPDFCELNAQFCPGALD